jgi:hypothetical protein
MKKDSNKKYTDAEVIEKIGAAGRRLVQRLKDKSDQLVIGFRANLAVYKEALALGASLSAIAADVEVENLRYGRDHIRTALVKAGLHLPVRRSRGGGKAAEPPADGNQPVTGETEDQSTGNRRTRQSPQPQAPAPKAGQQPQP